MKGALFERGARGMNEPNEFRLRAFCEVGGENSRSCNDWRNELMLGLQFLDRALGKAMKCDTISIGGEPVPISDDTRPMLLAFLSKAKSGLQRQLRDIEHQNTDRGGEMKGRGERIEDAELKVFFDGIPVEGGRRKEEQEDNDEENEGKQRRRWQDGGVQIRTDS